MQGRVVNFAKILSLLAALVVTSVVMGLLGAGLVMPAVGATGAVARQGVHVFDSLPGEFTTSPLSQQSRILASDGSLIATPYDENRIIVPLSAVALVMRKAQVAIEDSRFYEHGGLDTHGLARAVVETLKGNKQGASTLTQQYVKITLQENCLQKEDAACAARAVAREGTAGYVRKLQELKYAVTLEKELTKDQILEGYLNLVYYGDQAYGVEAAARHYFGVTAAKLNLQQAATLSGLVQQPSVTDPVHFPEKALERRNVVLDRMLELGIITPAEHTVARASKMVLKVTAPQNSCTASPYPYFCDYVIAWLKQQPALGNTVAERTKAIYRGGLTIQTTLDPVLQKKAQKDLETRVPYGNRQGIGAAAAVIEPGTGKILSMVQNTRYSNTTARGKTSVNWAADQAYGNSQGFQFGSTAKMFSIATALKQGMPVNSSVIAPPSGTTFYGSDFPDKCRPSPWTVNNDEPGSVGRVSLTKMTEQSINTAFAKLSTKVGVCAINDTMTAMGLHAANGRPINQGRTYNVASVVLGAGTVSPITLASGYATVAAEGKYCAPTPVLLVVDSTKKPLPVPKSSCKQALEPAVANGVTKVLSTVLTSGTAAGQSLADGRPASGKTGTTEENKQSWFAGYTPQLATAVWVGTPLRARHMANLSLGGKFYGGSIFGATIAAPIWRSIMNDASAGMPIRYFRNPSDRVTNGDTIGVPDVTGMSISMAKSVLRDRGFAVAVGWAISSGYPRGTVAAMSPNGGDREVRGATIFIRPSAGRRSTVRRPVVSTPAPAATKPPTKPKPTPTKPPRRH